MKNTSSSYVDLDSERSVLGAILIDNANLHEALGMGLSPTDFFLSQHQVIFQGMLDLERSGIALDLVTLTSRLNQTQQFQSIGGIETLTALFENAFKISNLEAYVKLVQERARLRAVGKACGDIQSELAGAIEDVPTFLNSVESKIFESTQSGRSEGLRAVRSMIPEFIQDVEERAERKADAVGLQTGFKEVDDITNGLKPHQVWVVAARPGMGKTSFVLSIIQNIAVRGTGVVAMFSMEMRGSELLQRLVSANANIDSKRLMLGRIHDGEWGTFAKAMEELDKAKIFVDDSGGVTALEIRSRCRRLKHREKKLDLVVIDYLQLIQPGYSKGNSTPESELATISRNLKELAKELDVPMIVLSQLNRATVTSGQDKRPTLANLRGSGAIEQDADLVAFIHRDDAYDEHAETKGTAEIIFAKNRAGAPGTAMLAWVPHLTLFANLEHGAGTPVRSNL